MTHVVTEIPAEQHFAFDCRHRTRTTLAIGGLFAALTAGLVAVTTGLSLVLTAGFDADPPDPYGFSLVVIGGLALNVAIATGPTAFALIRSVLRSTALTIGIGPQQEAVPLNCTASYRTGNTRIVAAVLTSIPTLGLSWLYFGPLMLARLLEAAAPANGVRFRFTGSRSTLAAHAAGIGIGLALANLGIQHLLFGPADPSVVPHAADLPREDTGPAELSPAAVIAFLAFVTATTLAVTWHLCRLALRGIHVSFPGKRLQGTARGTTDAVQAPLARLSVPRRHAAYVVGWIALGVATFGLALPFAYTSVLKRVLNCTGVPAGP